MITGLLYDKPDRSHVASFLKNDDNGMVLVVVWPKMLAGELISGKFPEVYRARKVENTSEFDWESMGNCAGYYIEN